MHTKLLRTMKSRSLSNSIADLFYHRLTAQDTTVEHIFIGDITSEMSEESLDQTLTFES